MAADIAHALAYLLGFFLRDRPEDVGVEVVQLAALAHEVGRNVQLAHLVAASDLFGQLPPESVEVADHYRNRLAFFAQGTSAR
jgi:hypothetical protein